MQMSSLGLAVPYTMPSSILLIKKQYILRARDLLLLQIAFLLAQLLANIFYSPEITQTVFRSSTTMESPAQSPNNKIRSKTQNYAFNLEQANLETKCAKFLKETNIFEFFRLNPYCDCNTDLRYNIKFQSTTFETNVNFKSSNFISTALRCVKSLLYPSKAQPEGISFKNEQLRIEVYDGKGTVYFNDTVLGSFLRRSPSFFCKTFSNEFIELIITPDKEDCFYELKKNSDCLNSCCECFGSQLFQ